MVQSFEVTDTFHEVVTRLGLHNSTLMTTFPRRIFGDEDATKTLKELGKIYLYKNGLVNKKIFL